MNQLYRLFAFIMLGCNALQVSAQCISLLNCPVKTDTFCAAGFNNSGLWNDPVFLDPINNVHDLFEASTDLSFQAKSTCGTAQVRYHLFLDLDGDGSQETVIDSDHLPPANTVFKGNALNPNFTGGDSINFDGRVVQANQKWGFTMEKVWTGDTITARLRWKTDLQPNQYVVPELPGGAHRIVWQILQSNGNIGTCSFPFRVVDCKAPALECQPLSVSIQFTGMLQLWASDFLKYTEDNVTPTNKLQIAVRKKGTGTGFPTDNSGKPITNIVFTCADLGTHLVELWSKDQTGNLSLCETSVIIQDNLGACGDPIPGYKVCALHGCNNKPIEEFAVKVSSTTQGAPSFEQTILIQPDINGCGNIKSSGLPFPVTASVEPFNDDNPLNGVSTYDLVLISKHILGLEPLNNPYKMIAADANRSGSITTYDIVEIRKLILGINTDFTNNTSWRFVDKGFKFPDENNPFKTLFPENVQINFPMIPAAPLEFIAIKVGDVNCSTSPLLTSDETTNRTAITLALPDQVLSAGEITPLSLQLPAAGQWLGAQFSLEYDPQVLEIQQVESSILPGFDAENWAQPHSGRLNVSWSGAVPVATLPNEPIITLRVKALAPVSLRDAFVFNNNRIHPELYDQEAQPVSLRLVFQQPTDITSGPAIFAPQPNPATSATNIPLRLTQPENVDVTVNDLADRVLYQRTATLDAGTHLLEIPASAFPQAGVYGWRVQAGSLEKTGKIIHQ